MAKDGKIRSFRRGWQHLRPVDMPKVKHEIMHNILGINNRNSWGQCIGRGFKMADIQAEAIERLFAHYGVPSSEVWDSREPQYEVVVLEATGNVQLYNKQDGRKLTFDSLSNLLSYTRQNNIETPTIGQMRFE